MNLYTETYKYVDKVYNYYIASRRDENDLSCLGSDTVDAVRIIPYFNKGGKTFVVLIYEFRHAINSYMYSVPAGLVDKGEQPLNAAIRELGEEIGAKVLKIKETEKASYVSAGMTDEKIACYEAEVEMGGKQHLDANEDIRIKIVELDDLENFINENQFGMQSALQLRAFIYRTKLEKNENLER